MRSRKTVPKEKDNNNNNNNNNNKRELSNMLVKKNVLNEINKKEGTFTQGFKDCNKIKRKVSQNLEDLQNLLIKLANCYC